MPKLMFPRALARDKPTKRLRTCAGHRAWVRCHYCSVPGCRRMPIECAHVRNGTDCGMGIKPSDKWTISLCQFHHREQHRLGEHSFEARYALDLRALAAEFARRSPHRLKLMRM